MHTLTHACTPQPPPPQPVIPHQPVCTCRDKRRRLHPVNTSGRRILVRLHLHVEHQLLTLPGACQQQQHNHRSVQLLVGRLDRLRLLSACVAFKGTDLLKNVFCYINPFTAPACKKSGLKDALTRLQTVHFPVLWHISPQCYAFLWKSWHKAARKKKVNKKA